MYRYPSISVVGSDGQEILGLILSVGEGADEGFEHQGAQLLLIKGWQVAGGQHHPTRDQQQQPHLCAAHVVFGLAARLGPRARRGGLTAKEKAPAAREREEVVAPLYLQCCAPQNSI